MPTQRPNIIFIMSDDHAAHALSCYGSRVNKTPHLDRIANDGMRLDNCFCTNSICEPSRASILTGTYSHVNRVTTIGAHLDNGLDNVAKVLQANGYQTGIVGKWHLGQGEQHWPSGFDYYDILINQGEYHNPNFVCDGVKRNVKGYVTDLITDMSIDWLDSLDADKPFMLMCHHKAPHRRWEPDAKHAHMYDDVTIPEPETFNDDYSNRASPAAAAKMRILEHLDDLDMKQPAPEGLTTAELKSWKYQRYMKDYLACIASVDDNIGRLLDYLDKKGLSENTIVVYTSDQGFFLGDHGWYDKRFMYEESLRMPFIIKYPQEIAPGSASEEMVLNVDFPALFLDYAGIDIPEHYQGRSFRELLQGHAPDDWRQSMYYRYWMHAAHHNVYAHYGIRTHRYKLIYYYADGLGQPGTPEGHVHEPEWELFDLKKDPHELNSVYNNPDYADIVRELKDELHRLQDEVGDQRYFKEESQ
ncbi:MAG: sulfatase [Lentisphaeria bacterium]